MAARRGSTPRTPAFLLRLPHLGRVLKGRALGWHSLAEDQLRNGHSDVGWLGEKQEKVKVKVRESSHCLAGIGSLCHLGCLWMLG